eukprot:COSAG02_NODE_3327_length_6930_cov_9.191187_2_plen_150_part_00
MEVCGNAPGCRNHAAVLFRVPASGVEPKLHMHLLHQKTLVGTDCLSCQNKNSPALDSACMRIDLLSVLSRTGWVRIQSTGGPRIQYWYAKKTIVSGLSAECAALISEFLIPHKNPTQPVISPILLTGAKKRTFPLPYIYINIYKHIYIS